ncbi:MAG TPA: UbiA family prenyltransferase [Opitutaceae bacterium]|nr:UbiA family prenyltransferase [Opitutaceae bacterium]
MKRWWIYQRERFPLVAHGPLILAFSASAVSYSALLRGSGAQRPALISFIVAFIVSLGSFLLLRIADEFKDQEEDANYRPYRPVPRGLVKLSELAWIGVGVGALQLVLAVQIGWPLVGLLAVTWIYFALMSREFFVRDWLKKRPVIYLFSHMAIMPLVDWFATGCDWVHASGEMPPGLFWFLAASFFNGIVIELGRKIRAPGDEERGVETYSFLWGRRVAVASWLSAMAATLACAGIAAQRIAFAIPLLSTLGACLVAATVLSLFFLRTPQRKTAKGIEALSGVWTLALYLTLGVIPLWLKP